MSTTIWRGLLFAALLLNAVASAAEETEVKGRVVDRDAGGAGLPGAKLSIWLHRRGDPNPISVCESRSRSDKNGNFSFPCELQADPVRLHVSRMAYVPNPRIVPLTMTPGETNVKGEAPFDGIPLSRVRDTRAYFAAEAQRLATTVLGGTSTLEEQAAAVRALSLRPEEEQMFLAALTTAVQEAQAQPRELMADLDTDTDALPSTASSLAVIGGLGVASMAAAFVLRRRRRNRGQ